jgi:20S proteasome subunit beta 1
MLQRPQSTLVPQQFSPAFRNPVTTYATLENGAHNASQQLFPPVPAIEDPQLSDAVSLGTTIMAVQYDGGVVLAADSRTSTGTYVVNRTTNKLTKLTKKIYCCRSGSAADTQAMAEITARYLREHEIQTGHTANVAAAAGLFQRLCYNNKWNISAGIIVAGWDPINGGSVFSIPLGGSCIKMPFAMGGSGSTYLYAWADQNFKLGMTKDQCLNFVRSAVAHALSRDGSSGGLVRTICLDATGEEHSTTPWTKIPYCMEKDPQFAAMALQNQAPSATSKDGQNQTDSTKQ